MSESFLPIMLACAAVTVLTRAGGYLALSRVRVIPPRVNAALEAVPAAVMVALAAPAALSGTWHEALAMGAAVVLSLRFGPTVTVVICAALLIALRGWG